ncbi:hypothetical protein ACTXT7_013404 [Hymenolepis weldensis]
MHWVPESHIVPNNMQANTDPEILKFSMEKLSVIQLWTHACYLSARTLPSYLPSLNYLDSSSWFIQYILE